MGEWKEKNVFRTQFYQSAPRWKHVRSRKLRKKQDKKPYIDDYRQFRRLTWWGDEPSAPTTHTAAHCHRSEETSRDRSPNRNSTSNKRKTMKERMRPQPIPTRCTGRRSPRNNRRWRIRIRRLPSDPHPSLSSLRNLVSETKGLLWLYTKIINEFSLFLFRDSLR